MTVADGAAASGVTAAEPVDGVGLDAPALHPLMASTALAVTTQLTALSRDPSDIKLCSVTNAE